MFIKNDKIEIDLKIEDLRHFEIKNAEDLKGFVAEFVEVPLGAGFKTNGRRKADKD